MMGGDTVSALSSGISQADLDAAAQQNLALMQAQIPVPATTAPPGVADISAAGAVTRYAREDHTHRSSMQAQRMTATLASGKFTWTFPFPYDAGVVPVVNTTAESPDPSGGFVLDARIIAGTVTNTGCQITVNKIAASQTLGATLLAIAGTVVGIITPATGTAVVHCWARKP